MFVKGCFLCIRNQSEISICLMIIKKQQKQAKSKSSNKKVPESVEANKTKSFSLKTIPISIEVFSKPMGVINIRITG